MKSKKKTIEERYQQVIKLIECSEQVVRNSTIIPEHLKRDYLTECQTSRSDAEEYLNTKNHSFLKQLEVETLTPWNESYDEDSLQFWQFVQQSGLEIERENHLEKILHRGRIANFKEYNIVQDSLVLWHQEGQISNEQADLLSRMLGAFEAKRAK